MRLHFEAHGCALNRGEARELRDAAELAGHYVSCTRKDAEALVLSTCTVIQSTEDRMLAIVRDWSSLGKPVIVAGCMASARPEQVRMACPQAVLLPPRKNGEFLKLVGGLEGRERVGANAQAEAGPSVNAGGLPWEERAAPVIADVPIADGCRGRCSYCITRLARGPLKSRPAEEVVTRVADLVERGCREVRLAALDSGQYGKDMDDELPNLLEKVCAVEGDFRVRVGMMNPESLLPMMDGMLDALQNEKMFRFLHVPVQSGDDGILEKMRRGYRADDFRTVVKRYRDRFPFGLLSTDVIVGFPGEGDDAHLRTLKLLEETRPSILNVKLFSPRPGTPAARLKRTVGPADAKRRTGELAALHARLFRANSAALAGRSEPVLITEKARGGVLGRTPDYHPVIIRKRLEPGIWLRVTLAEAKSGFLVGTPWK